MASRSLDDSPDELDEKRLACTVIVSVPKALKRLSTALVEPPPMAVSATTAPTPMTMPRMVSTARSGLARRLEKARRSDSRKTIIDCRPASPAARPAASRPAARRRR